MDNSETVRGRRRENESAQVLARHGYEVEQNPVFPEKDPDFRIEGRIFDNYSPKRSTRVRSVYTAVKGKLQSRQTRRVVVNLDDSPLTVEEVVEQFKNWPMENLEEVLAVKDGKVHQIFPSPNI